jgi:hypothetical protein
MVVVAAVVTTELSPAGVAGALAPVAAVAAAVGSRSLA